MSLQTHFYDNEHPWLNFRHVMSRIPLLSLYTYVWYILLRIVCFIILLYAQNGILMHKNTELFFEFVLHVIFISLSYKWIVCQLQAGKSVQKYFISACNGNHEEICVYNWFL